MKVLQVTHRYPPQVGGVETHVREVSERLVERGHDVTVFSGDAQAASESQEVRNGVVVRRFRSFAPGGAIYLAPGIPLAVWRTVARRSGGRPTSSRVDVVHAHNYHALPALGAAIGVDQATFVLTPHYHASSAIGFRDRLLTLYQPLGRWALRRADQVVAVSDWERDRLRADFGVDATVIPSGLDVERFAGAEPCDADGPYLLSVGRLEEYKGVQHLIRALPELPEYELLVVGQGPYRGDLESLVRMEEIADRVEFLGHVPDDQLPGLYAGAEVFVTLSSFEAYGMSVAEALVAGTPCVVRDRAALGDWVSTPGVVGVEDVDARSVVEAIRTAESLGPPTVELPTWDDCVDEIERCYQVTSHEKG